MAEGTEHRQQQSRGRQYRQYPSHAYPLKLTRPKAHICATSRVVHAANHQNWCYRLRSTTSPLKRKQASSSIGAMPQNKRAGSTHQDRKEIAEYLPNPRSSRPQRHHHMPGSEGRDCENNGKRHQPLKVHSPQRRSACACNRREVNRKFHRIGKTPELCAPRGRATVQCSSVRARLRRAFFAA